MKKFCISRNQPFGKNKPFISIVKDIFFLVQLKSVFKNKHVDLTSYSPKRLVTRVYTIYNILYYNIL